MRNLIPILIVASAVGAGFRYLFQDKDEDEVSNEQLRESLKTSRKQVKQLTRLKNERQRSGNWFEEETEEEKS